MAHEVGRGYIRRMARVPLYRLQGHGDHFYTTSADERDAAIAQYGYASEGIACYVEDSPAPAAPPPELLTVRDSMAIAAMTSILTEAVRIGENADEVIMGSPHLVQHRAAAAYQIADALLKAR